MGNRIGIIFHEDYQRFSPLFYSQNGGYYFNKECLEGFCGSCLDNGFDGDIIYDCGFVLGLFVLPVDHTKFKIKNLSDQEIELLKTEHKYPNYFDGGCLLVDVSKKNFGVVEKA